MKIIDKDTVELTPGEMGAKDDFEDLLDRGMSIPQAVGATITLNPTVFEFPTNEPFIDWLMGPYGNSQGRSLPKLTLEVNMVELLNGVLRVLGAISASIEADIQLAPDAEEAFYATQDWTEGISWGTDFEVYKVENTYFAYETAA